MKRHKVIKVFLFLIVLAVFGGAGFLVYKHYNMPESEISVTDDMRERVREKSPYAYPNKSFMGVDLTGKTELKKETPSKSVKNKQKQS